MTQVPEPPRYFDNISNIYQEHEIVNILNLLCEKYQVALWKDEDGYNCVVEDDDMEIVVIYSENTKIHSLLEVLILAKKRIEDKNKETD